ncbi:MAG: hypothetical protein WD042_00220 [Phycisphaeraceae bacterium]
MMRFLLSMMLIVLSPVMALAAPPAQWQRGVPVDQAVADLDPLAVGMRQMQAGLRDDGEQSSLFRVELPAGDRPASVRPEATSNAVYYRIGPGFRARVERVDYLVPVDRKKKKYMLDIAPKQDGEFIEVSPMDTVYDLRPVPPGATVAPEPQISGPDYRIDGRVGAKIDGRVDGQR